MWAVHNWVVKNFVVGCNIINIKCFNTRLTHFVGVRSGTGVAYMCSPRGKRGVTHRLRYVGVSDLSTLISDGLISYIVMTAPGCLRGRPMVGTTGGGGRIFYRGPVTLDCRSYISVIGTYGRTNIAFVTKRVVGFFGKIRCTQGLVGRNIVNRVLSYRAGEGN